ncbi:MAG: hypothetical protein JWM56_528 [Candidatus Peribacteria bacterium]|nr:hypothetical protein [Candidatus Peribacteria bacterium]
MFHFYSQREKYPKKFLLIGSVVLLVLIASVYAQTLTYGFINLDDPSLVTENTTIQAISLHTVGRAFTTYDPELYVPFTLLSYQLDWFMGNGAAWVFHLTNILLHMGSTLLVMGLILQLRPRKYLPAFLGAAVFAVHPAHADTVVWVSSRKDLLSTVFLLGSLLMYLKYQKNMRQQWLGTSIILFAFALLSKVTVLLLPLTFPFFMYAQGQATDRSQIKKTYVHLWPFLVYSFIFAAIALHGKTQLLHNNPVTETLPIVPYGILFSLGKILVPVHLTLAYPYLVPVAWTSPLLIASLVLCLIIFGSIFFIKKKYLLPLSAFVFFLLALSPSLSNLSTNGIHFITTNRYLYLPSIGLIIFCSIWLSDILNTKMIRKYALYADVFLLIIFTYMSVRQAGLWRDPLILFTHMEQLYPRFYLPSYVRGTEWADKNEWRAAVREYEHSLALHPRNADGWSNLGAAYAHFGRTADETETYRKALAIDPHMLAARLNLGMAFMDQKKFPEAKNQLEEVLRQNPGNAMAEELLKQLASKP